jgi:hypothetical protein
LIRGRAYTPGFRKEAFFWIGKADRPISISDEGLLSFLLNSLPGKEALGVGVDPGFLWKPLRKVGQADRPQK